MLKGFFFLCPPHHLVDYLGRPYLQFSNLDLMIYLLSILLFFLDLQVDFCQLEHLSNEKYHWANIAWTIPTSLKLLVRTANILDLPHSTTSQTICWISWLWYMICEKSRTFPIQGHIQHPMSLFKSVNRKYPQNTYIYRVKQPRPFTIHIIHPPHDVIIHPPVWRHGYR